jgi:uncharacterized protein with HEPN domain
MISSASKHIPTDLVEQQPTILWRLIRGMGNILRHEYHGIANDVIWDVTQHDLPPSKAAIFSMRDRLRHDGKSD